MKSLVAGRKLRDLIIVLNERARIDEAEVIRHLSPREQKVYLKAKPFYAKGSGKGYCFDQRHIDFSTLMSLRLLGNAERDVVVPAVICHDIGRYKTPEGVTEIDHSSFTQRVLHMFEGERLVRNFMREAGYSIRKSEEAARIIALHDWAYLSFMNPEEELSKSNPTVNIDGIPTKISEMYEHQFRIARKGVFDTHEFIAYRESDRVNVPAVASFAKDYLKRSKYYQNFSPMEFALLRFGYFGMLDQVEIPERVSAERLSFVKSQVKLERLNTARGDKVARDILDARLNDVGTGYLNLDNGMSREAFKAFLGHTLDKELEYAVELS